MLRKNFTILFIIVFLFLSHSILHAATWYVKTDGNDPGDCSNGQSWATAYESIGKAVDCASDGDEVWVKQGAYSGVNSGWILVDEAIGIYGGFNGTEVTRSQRNWQSYITTLDGGESNTVRYFFITDNAVIDGFTITNGDYSSGGGAISISAGATIANCTFTNNNSDSSGGAISIGSSSSPTITNCTFTGNTASGNGGAIYIGTTGTGTITGCVFSSSNSANYGGAIACNSSDINISGCTFTGSTADTNGGAINISNTTGSISNCTFTNNSVSGPNYGGGICNTNGTTVTISDCTFTENAAASGAGIYNSSNTTITRCLFIGNTADTTTNGSGAGIYNGSSTPTITNCIFAGNSSTYIGGGIMNYSSANAIITNCTFTGNNSDTNGTITSSDSNPTITNCILWNNTGDEIHNISSSAPVISYCNIDQDGYVGSNNNIRSDPMFKDVSDSDPTNWDLHLKRKSPCIDMGNTSATGIPTIDFEGDERVIDGDRNGTASVDIGADEYIPKGMIAHLLMLLLN
ncbi:MAG: right-handed parallel beta-helix repeat-containing protein [Deltaproteobacteria bacterium]|nr:right-handed parallel beta-helix repeat-containing protein [Deltaproteobacteria bacterium]